jgi:signal recognition particle subunit SEC65
MDKIGKIVKSFSEEEYNFLYESVSSNKADKSSLLLKIAREKNMEDKDCVTALDIKPNAFYTLKSRLNQKIESYLISKMEAPKMDLIKKVSYATDIFLTTDRTILSVMLKRLEKELSDYDLPYELTKIYQMLKKLYVTQPEQQYQYSQLYNKNVAYTLALDRAEDATGRYFQAYGSYFMSKSIEDLIQLEVIQMELDNTAKLYESHRLYVLNSMVKVFHILFVPSKNTQESLSDVEDIFDQVSETFAKFPTDTGYLQMAVVFDFLKFEYYHKLGLPKKEAPYYEQVNFMLGNFLQYYNFNTFPGQFLLSKLERVNKLGTESGLLEENETTLEGFNPDMKQLPTYIIYHIYLAICHFYTHNYKQAARTLNNLKNDVSFKNYPHIEMEIKLLLALQYAKMKEEDMTMQLIKSVQRQIRNDEARDYNGAKMFIKVLNKIISGQGEKASDLLERYRINNIGEEAVLVYLKLDESKI